MGGKSSADSCAEQGSNGRTVLQKKHSVLRVQGPSGPDYPDRSDAWTYIRVVVPVIGPIFNNDLRD